MKAVEVYAFFFNHVTKRWYSWNYPLILIYLSINILWRNLTGSSSSWSRGCWSTGRAGVLSLLLDKVNICKIVSIEKESSWVRLINILGFPNEISPKQMSSYIRNDDSLLMQYAYFFNEIALFVVFWKSTFRRGRIFIVNRFYRVLFILVWGNASSLEGLASSPCCFEI